MKVVKCDKCHNGLEEITEGVYDYCRKCNGLGYINNKIIKEYGN